MNYADVVRARRDRAWSTLARRWLAAALLGAAGANSAIAGASPAAEPEEAIPQLALPPVGLHARDLALIVNDADPASLEIGRYYASRRGIPDAHVIHVDFPAGQASMSASDFERVQTVLRARMPKQIQAYALAWTLPYRVECMSVTSAFAFGLEPAYCAQGCQPTRPSAYFDSQSNAPFRDHGLRPAMLLAGKDVAGAKALIDRGVRADNRWPDGVGYLLDTSDRKRNVRAATYAPSLRKLAADYPIQHVYADAIESKPAVMFYFTGAQHVGAMATNHFVDGAIGDHLTSLGGMLTDSFQMSAMAWLDAGATGSFGATVEPCNYPEKFPDVGVVMAHYLGGETLIEAYWKSVRMPGQGVFIGEPLARPFGGVRLLRVRGALHAQTRLLRPGPYLLQAAPGRVGPFRTVGLVRVPGHRVQEFLVPDPAAGFFRLVAEPTLPGH